jgi:hypothetical protein
MLLRSQSCLGALEDEILARCGLYLAYLEATLSFELENKDNLDPCWPEGCWRVATSLSTTLLRWILSNISNC